MKFSYKLLSTLVDLSSCSVDELVNKLTFAQFEVEGVEKAASASSLVIGQVTYCEKHPDSDHLHVLKVNCGQEGVLDIVCGAPNVAKGKKVIVALPGCELKAIDVTIKKGVIRGFESNGMCCSLSELGVSKESQSEEDLAGIHLLDDDAPIGERNVLGYLGLDDTILDINILPNRPDCLSHIGLAREISTLINAKLLFDVSSDLPQVKQTIKVTSSTPSCDKFLLAEVTNLSKGETPKEVVNYLRSLGIRPVSKIVDLGNYAMLLTGQPLHMYDLDKVEGDLEVVSNYQGKILALNDKEYDVIEGDIVIKDKVKPCCLGGVMGLKSVEVDDSTSHIGIEAAHFYHADIRHTSSRLGLVSDSSQLFVKGTNPYLLEENFNYTLKLLKEFFPEAEIKGLSIYNKVEDLKGSYPFSIERLNKRLGSCYPQEVVLDVLNRLHLSFDGKEIKKNKYRLDLVEQCDIDEEVFRLSDQKYIDISLNNMPITSGELNPRQLKIRKVRETLIQAGLNETITYTLINDKLNKELRVFNNESFKVLHPLSDDHLYVRSDILSSLAQAINYNKARKHSDLALFEISPVDTPNGHHTYLSIGLNGFKSEQGVLRTRKYDFYDLKGLLIRVMDTLGFNDRRYSLIRSKNSSFHPGRSADILIGKKVIGTFGETMPKGEYANMYLLELDLEEVVNQHSSKFKMQQISLIQPIRRDLAFVLLDENVTSADIIREIKKAGGKYLLDVQVFDIFNKDGITSLAFALTLVREERSFTDDEINSLLNTIILNVTHTLKVKLKG